MSVTTRPMVAADVDGIGACARAAFGELSAAFGEPRPEEQGSAQQQRYLEIYGHLHSTDPEGCHVAVDAGRVVGAALAFVRDDLWSLALLVVTPDAQGRGVGQRLLDDALETAASCPRAWLSSSRGAAAMRRYVRAGFTPHPALRATGTARRAALAAVDGVRDGVDPELADAVDARVRGARRGSDHDMLSRDGRSFCVDSAAGQGYAYLPDDGRIVLAGTTVDVARALLVTCLAESDGRDADVGHLTTEQAWALGPCLDAGLALKPSGPMMVRAMTPPAPYLPSGLFL